MPFFYILRIAAREVIADITIDQNIIWIRVKYLTGLKPKWPMLKKSKVAKLTIGKQA